MKEPEFFIKEDGTEMLKVFYDNDDHYVTIPIEMIPQALEQFKILEHRVRLEILRREALESKKINLDFDYKDLKDRNN